VHRRKFLLATAAATAASVYGTAAQQSAPAAAAEPKLRGRLKQSACRWCYGKLSLDELCKAAADIGLASVELLNEDEWPTVRKYGLTCAVANGPGPIPDGWNRTENHEKLIAESLRLLPRIRDAGIPNMIVFSGNRGGMADEPAIANCVAGLKQIIETAEKVGVTVVMEGLSSKDHKDYHYDRTALGVRIAEGVASPRFKLLYDIYHMQRMEGDVVATIREHIEHIGHFHTGGVPGRNEIDESQELNYAMICKAIVDLGYSGYLGQEFIPRRDPIDSLRKAALLCDV
jgi:hydroxypyruvate isomerase